MERGSSIFVHSWAFDASLLQQTTQEKNIFLETKGRKRLLQRRKNAASSLAKRTKKGVSLTNLSQNKKGGLLHQ